MLGGLKLVDRKAHRCDAWEKVRRWTGIGVQIEAETELERV